MLDLVMARIRQRDREREIEADLRNRQLLRELKTRQTERGEALDDHEERALIAALFTVRPR